MHNEQLRPTFTLDMHYEPGVTNNVPSNANNFLEGARHGFGHFPAALFCKVLQVRPIERHVIAAHSQSPEQGYVRANEKFTIKSFNMLIFVTSRACQSRVLGNSQLLSNEFTMAGVGLHLPPKPPPI